MTARLMYDSISYGGPGPNPNPGDIYLDIEGAVRCYNGQEWTQVEPHAMFRMRDEMMIEDLRRMRDELE